MEKNKKGKTVLIVFLLLIVIGLIGYIVYDKYIDKDIINDYKTEIEELNNQIKELKASLNSEKENQVDLVGAYIGTYDAPKEVGRPTETDELLIVDEENAIFCSHIGTDTECYKGDYLVNDDKLIIYSTEKQELDFNNTEPSDNDNTYLYFIIEKNQIIPDKSRTTQNAFANLTKADASKLQYANKAFKNHDNN